MLPADICNLWEIPRVSAARTHGEAAFRYPLGRAARSRRSPDSRIMHSYISGFCAVVVRDRGYSENSPLGYRVNQPTND